MLASTIVILRHLIFINSMYTHDDVFTIFVRLRRDEIKHPSTIHRPRIVMTSVLLFLSGVGVDKTKRHLDHVISQKLFSFEDMVHACAQRGLEEPPGPWIRSRRINRIDIVHRVPKQCDSRVTSLASLLTSWRTMCKPSEDRIAKSSPDRPPINVSIETLLR